MLSLELHMLPLSLDELALHELCYRNCHCLRLNLSAGSQRLVRLRHRQRCAWWGKCDFINILFFLRHEGYRFKRR